MLLQSADGPRIRSLRFGAAPFLDDDEDDDRETLW
jgi:hypothetical protein